MHVNFYIFTCILKCMCDYWNKNVQAGNNLCGNNTSVTSFGNEIIADWAGFINITKTKFWEERLW